VNGGAGAGNRTRTHMTSEDDIEPIEIGLREGDILECRYRVERLLSHGGMSSVYLGANDRIKRQVAIKVLHEVDAGRSADASRRFENEAQAAGRIGSKHIVEVLDVGTTPRGESFLVMEYLDGETLKDRLERGPVTPGELVPIVRQLLEGLGAAHAAGIVHLDLKPGNVFLMRERRARAPGTEDFELVKILDFGIARFQPLESDPGKSIRTVMGTAHYMSPEQAVGERRLDGRTDLYAVGVILYRAITGRVPFSGTPFDQILQRVVFERPPRPRELAPALDASFEAIILKAMARDPDDRYQTAEEFALGLTAWQRQVEDDRATTLEPKPVSSKKPPPLPVKLPPPETATSWGTRTSRPPPAVDREGPRMALVAAVACAFGTGALALGLTLARSAPIAAPAAAPNAALLARIEPAFAPKLSPIVEPPAPPPSASPVAKAVRPRASAGRRSGDAPAPTPAKPLSRRAGDPSAAVEDYGY